MTVQLYRASIRGVDPHVYEYTLRPGFWLLGIFLGIIWTAVIWTRAPPTGSSILGKQPAAQDALTDSALEQDNPDKILLHDLQQLTIPGTIFTTSSGGRFKPHYTLWLVPFLSGKPHYTSRRVIVTGFYLCILAIALLEMYWIGMTFTRATVKILRFWDGFRKRGNRTWVYGTASLGLFGMMALDVAALLLGSFFVVPLVLCVFEVVSLRLESERTMENAARIQGLVVSQNE